MKKYILSAVLGLAIVAGGFTIANVIGCKCGPACACNPCTCGK